MAILLIDNFDSFTYNLYQMLQAQTEREVKVVRNDAIGLEEILALQPDRVVLSPGPGHPANPSDVGVCAGIIEHQEELGCPVLGVCLGHQTLVHRLGGEVSAAPRLFHGKPSVIEQNGKSPLFAGLPERFEVMRYHSLVAKDERFPEALEVLAREPEESLIMAAQHKARPLYGIQFHPESIGTPEGGRILRNFLEHC